MRFASICVKTSRREKPFIWNCVPLLVHFHSNQTHVHTKGFARRLVLSHKVTRKWPISCCTGSTVTGLQTPWTCRNNTKKCLRKSDDAHSLLIRVQTMVNHISICFLPQYQRQRKCFLQSATWKRHCATHWHQQLGMDSYRQRQISQSDCEISNFSKKWNWGYICFEIMNKLHLAWVKNSVFLYLFGMNYEIHCIF